MANEVGEQGLFMQEMAVAARAFCTIIDEVVAGAGAGWLRSICDLLPSLHVAAVALPEVPDTGELEDLEDDLDTRFELYGHLLERLGEHDTYWLEFDPIESHGDHVLSGSLADDLVDIYFDLQFGLALYESMADDPTPAVAHWRRSYRTHWGPHLVDAERHLYALKARDHLDH